jgi:DHA2 family multidrug resistance protein-like MFS transporter
MYLLRLPRLPPDGVIATMCRSILTGHAMPPFTENNQSDRSEEGLPAPRRYFALAAVLAAMVLVVLDGAIANVALPTIAGALQVSPGASVWIVTGYQLALVIAILPCAALGESLGYRRVFVAGVVLFTAASALCALSPSLVWLVVARFLQGLGGAALMALGVALLRFTYPPRRLGAVIGWNSLTIALSAAIGPTVGAAIISVAGWPWLFAVNLPVGAVVLLTGRALPKPQGTARKLDLVSVALNAATFGSLVLGAELMMARPWLGSALLVAAVICLVALIRREMPRRAPLIPLDLLRGGSFRISVIASVCCFAGQMASYIALPFYLQHGLGQDAFTTGLYMTPWPLTVAFAGPISGRLADRVSTAWLCAAGGIGLAAGLALACLWPLQDDLLPIVPFTMLSGLGFGFFQVPNNRNMFISAPRERSGAAGGMQGTARLVGQTVGAVIMTMLFSLVSLQSAPRIGLAIAALLALAGGLVSALRVERG